ncbi:hypothetical protein STAQ_37330 [Allostella sp. ATCC 35155]|nr:hypothetical protein STAQ_37330 [Stella sp. ATCC 35155]
MGFVVAEYVVQECSRAAHSRTTPANTRALEHLDAVLKQGDFAQRVELSVDDLREVARLEGIKRLGIGELAAIVVARKLRCGFVSDDRAARRFATDFLDPEHIRTISHLVGHLVYLTHLGDGDVATIIADNKALRADRGCIAPYIQACVTAALQFRLVDRQDVQRG